MDEDLNKIALKKVALANELLRMAIFGVTPLILIAIAVGYQPLTAAVILFDIAVIVAQFVLEHQALTLQRRDNLRRMRFHHQEDRDAWLKMWMENYRKDVDKQ